LNNNSKRIIKNTSEDFGLINRNNSFQNCWKDGYFENNITLYIMKINIKINTCKIPPLFYKKNIQQSIFLFYEPNDLVEQNYEIIILLYLE
jgi:hypothetical protein